MNHPRDVFPTIRQQEKEEIQALDVNNLQQNGYLKIYPCEQNILLENSYQFICDRINSTIKNGRGLVFANSGPSNSIDAWIFRSSRPTLLLTFITDDAPEADCLQHNNNIANMTTNNIRTNANVDFDLIHGVVDRETSSCTEKFRHKLCEMEKCGFRATGHFLSMDSESFGKVVKSFIDEIHVKDAGVVSETESTAQETKPFVKCLVVSSQQQDSALNRHVEFLQKANFQAHQMKCKDADALTAMNVTEYDRLDLLVDSQLCSLLKRGHRLKDAVDKFFDDIEQNGTEIVLFNLFPSDDDGDDFNELFYQVPRKTRKRPLESAYHDRLPAEKKQKPADRPIVKSVQIGYKNKATINPTSKQAVLVYQRGTSNVINLVAPNEHSQLKISTSTNPDRPDIEEKIITVMKKQTEDEQTAIPGVSFGTIEKGSIVIKLELEPGQTVTDQWLTTVLQALFTDEVCAVIPDGVSLDVDIDATVVVKGEDMPKLTLDSGTHENCVSLSKFEELQYKYENLKQTIDYMKAERISDWMERATVTTSSGYHTASTVSSEDNSDDVLVHFMSKDVLTLVDSKTQDCSQCWKLHKEYASKGQSEYCFVLHGDRHIIIGSFRNAEKKMFLQKLEKYAAALLNTSGGEILIHLNGQKPGDRCLEFFDEMITKPLELLLGDTQLYSSNYSREWLSISRGMMQYSDYILLRVNKLQSVATVDFNTKFRNDIENYCPCPLLIMSVLSQPAPKTRGPMIKGLSAGTIHEDRNTELKMYYPRHDSHHYTSDDIVDFIWSDLKLKQNITSMAKIPDGGSVFIGISKLSDGTADYKTKTSHIKGFDMPCTKNEFKRTLYRKLTTHMCVLDRATLTFQNVPTDLIDVAFHPVPHISPDRVVLEVAIRYFDGIVFYDKNGPRTYKIENGNVCRMNNKEWLEHLRNFPVFIF